MKPLIVRPSRMIGFKRGGCLIEGITFPVLGVRFRLAKAGITVDRLIDRSRRTCERASCLDRAYLDFYLERKHRVLHVANRRAIRSWGRRCCW